MSNKEHLGLFDHIFLIRTQNRTPFFFFLDSLFFKEYSVKFSKNFSASSTGWHPVQPVHRVSLYGALVLVVLEHKSYLVRAHKFQISPRHDLGPVIGHFVGFLQPTLTLFWILGG